MTWLEALSKVAEINKLINTIEFQMKEQDKEISLLRNDNADIRRQLSALGERVARLEEARNTTSVQIAAVIAKSEADAKLEALLSRMALLVDENETLKRKQLPPG